VQECKNEQGVHCRGSWRGSSRPCSHPTGAHPSCCRACPWRLQDARQGARACAQCWAWPVGPAPARALTVVVDGAVGGEHHGGARPHLAARLCLDLHGIYHWQWPVTLCGSCRAWKGTGALELRSVSCSTAANTLPSRALWRGRDRRQGQTEQQLSAATAHHAVQAHLRAQHTAPCNAQCVQCTNADVDHPIWRDGRGVAAGQADGWRCGELYSVWRAEQWLLGKQMAGGAVSCILSGVLSTGAAVRLAGSHAPSKILTPFLSRALRRPLRYSSGWNSALCGCGGDLVGGWAGGVEAEGAGQQGCAMHPRLQTRRWVMRAFFISVCGARWVCTASLTCGGR